MACFALSLKLFRESSPSVCDGKRLLGVRGCSKGLRRPVSVGAGSLTPGATGSGVLALYGLGERWPLSWPVCFIGGKDDLPTRSAVSRSPDRSIPLDYRKINMNKSLLGCFGVQTLLILQTYKCYWRKRHVTWPVLPVVCRYPKWTSFSGTVSYHLIARAARTLFWGWCCCIYDAVRCWEMKDSSCYITYFSYMCRTKME